MGEAPERTLHDSRLMWILIAIGLVIGWLALKLVWGVASLAVHFLLGAAVVALVVHFAQKWSRHRDAPAGA